MKHEFRYALAGVVVIVLIFLSTPSALGKEQSNEPVRETSKKTEYIDGKASFYIRPPVVQAGSYPKFVGEVFTANVLDTFPGYRNLKDAESIEIARKLSFISGPNRLISSFLPAGWEPTRGVPLAFISDDLVTAGYSGSHEDAAIGMLDILRIELATPNYKTAFPYELVLHLDFTKGTKERTYLFDMIFEEGNAVYRLKDIHAAHSKLLQVASEFGRRRGFDDDPTVMRMSKLTGFNPHESISGLPAIEGAVLTHHVYIGSFRVVSGWQWAGRPIGLHGSQQPGFVQ